MRNSSPDERLRQEFLAESEEIVEELSRDLLLLDQCVEDNKVDYDILNGVFRSMHTLKGISGIFGHSNLTNLTHCLEGWMDDLRMGKRPIDREAIDRLFEGLRYLQMEIVKFGNGEDAPFRKSVVEFIESVQVSDPQNGEVDSFSDIDPNIVSVLTTYEESRLRKCLAEDKSLFMVTLPLALDAIDTAINEIKQKLRAKAEIITYIPRLDENNPDLMLADVLIASSMLIGDLQNTVGEHHIRITPAKTPSVALTGPPDRAMALAPMVAAGRQVLRKQEYISKTSSNTVRVNIEKLDELMGVLGGLAIAGSGLGKLIEKVKSNSSSSKISLEFVRVQKEIDHQIDELRSRVLSIRMVPIGNLFEKLSRGVRQIARELDKEVKLVVTGTSTEMDKLIVEELSEPLMHIVRNAIDHGIEPRETRVSLGKPEVGTIAINAFQHGRHVVIEVQDDGQGVNREKLKESVMKANILEGPNAAHEHELLNYIFVPGVTTADSVTEISGRGVGLDVVRNNIGRFGGLVDVTSNEGVGTKFSLTVPTTLAVIHALLFRVSEHDFAVPLDTVVEILSIERNSIRRIHSENVIDFRGNTLPLCNLSEFFGYGRAGGSRCYIIVMALSDRKVGIVVDSLIAQKDIVIKSLGKSLETIQGVSGATELEDRRVALVLDVAAILEGGAITLDASSREVFG